MRAFTRFARTLLFIAFFSAAAAYAADPTPTAITLTRRVDNEAYGTAAYSFRLASQDFSVHRNYVDLVFNVCGRLHFNPVNGMSSRVVDVGPVPFGPAVIPAADAIWLRQSFIPKVGHVYLQEIKDERQSFPVMFTVTEVNADAVKLLWRPVDPSRQVLPLAVGKGATGTMGQCGGAHPEQ